MKVFISADIEGTAFTTIWEECRKEEKFYAAATREMTAEVVAACEGAIAAGADYILINDAHGPAINIDPNALPDCAEIIRGWSGDPMCMVEGIDEGFDAAMFVGYHSAAGNPRNPLSHTYTLKNCAVRLNGKRCSEFMLYSGAALLKKVPTVLLTGDRSLCEESASLHPSLKTVAVKDGWGGITRCVPPALAQKKIKEAAQAALSQDLKKALGKLPKHFIFEVEYKECRDAVRLSYYPGCELAGDRTVKFESDDYFEVLRCAKFIL